MSRGISEKHVDFHHIGVLLACFIIAIFASFAESFSQEFDLVKDPSPTVVCDAVCDRLRKNAGILGDRTIDANLVITGIEMQIPQMLKRGGGVVGSTGNSVRRLRFVIGTESGYCKGTMGDGTNYITTRDGGKWNQYYLSRAGAIEGVTISCGQAASPPELSLYLSCLDRKGWSSGGIQLDIEYLCKEISEASFVGRELNNFYGSVLVFEKERAITNAHGGDSPIQTQLQRWYIGEKFSSLFLVGIEYVGKSSGGTELRRAGFSELLTRDRWKMEYMQLDDIVLQSEWRRIYVEERVLLSGASEHPVIKLDLRCKVEGCKIVDKFPNDLINIALPANAKVRDVCNETRQLSLSREILEARRTNYWQYLLLAIVVCGGLYISPRLIRKNLKS